MFSKFFFFPENRAVYATNWKPIIHPDRSQTSQYGVSVMHAG